METPSGTNSCGECCRFSRTAPLKTCETKTKSFTSCMILTNDSKYLAPGTYGEAGSTLATVDSLNGGPSATMTAASWSPSVTTRMSAMPGSGPTVQDIQNVMPHSHTASGSITSFME